MRFLLLILIVMVASSGYSQVTITHNGKSKSRIIVGDDVHSGEAATILRDFVQRISNVAIPVVSGVKPGKGDIVIDNRSAEGVGEDGFFISTRDNILHISAGEGKGVIYGVVTVLERYWGVDYWGENEFSVKKTGSLSLPLVEYVENPAFRYRQTQFYGMSTDSLYKLWHRLDVPSEVFAANYWVHTFDKLMPSSKYGISHPEYYSFFKGKRHPGKASQWCLTNPDVLEIVAGQLDSIFKANPDKHIISVSQNDGNYTNCACAGCKAIDDYEGSFAGSLITFVNKLAERFPDKEISTLAYLYTMKPPRHVKPLPNVNIMLCDIDCDREVSLTENRSGREFVEAMKGWSAISNNIFVWDYGINFDNYLSPFPNFHILRDNIRLFRDNNATMHFSQIASSRGGNFAELRSWMVAKLMWNPDADSDSLMNHFLDGYYGSAAPFIYRYIKMMEGALLGSGERLWIYDSPVTHKNGMLKPELMIRYNQLFDHAEEAVRNDSVLLGRVQRARLPLQYSQLEIMRTEKEVDYAVVEELLSLFEQRVRLFKVPTLNERNNSPLDYCKLYRQRYMPAGQKSLALGADVEFSVKPTGKYASIGNEALTDGLYGGTTFVESWVGWEGVDASFTVDLGSKMEFRVVETDFLHQVGAWILFPLSVTYSVSDDGVNFKLLEHHNLGEDRSVEVKFLGVRTNLAQPVAARFVKVDIEATKTCPQWHYGVGHPSWVFVDEVSVY
jgi:hypothetical protein